MAAKFDSWFWWRVWFCCPCDVDYFYLAMLIFFLAVCHAIKLNYFLALLALCFLAMKINTPSHGRVWREFEFCVGVYHASANA